MSGWGAAGSSWTKRLGTRRLAMLRRGGSDATERDGWPMRRVAAKARRVLLELAAKRFGVPIEAVEQLNVSDAVITLKSDPSRRVTYAELIDGKQFNVTPTGG